MLKTVFKKFVLVLTFTKELLLLQLLKQTLMKLQNTKLNLLNTFTDDLIECRDWLKSNDTLYVCMESTGKYWIPVWNVLESICNCFLTHPKYVRSIPGKIDIRIAKWIAEIFKYNLIEPSFIPPLDIRNLRELMRYRNKLINMRSSEKNRFQNSLTVSNIQIANVVTDVFGKTSQSILKLMLSNPNLTLDDITPLLNKNLKSSPEEILKSINGTFDSTQSSKMNVCLKHFDYINECIDEIEQEVLKLAIKYTTEINLLTTIPGIREFSAIFIIAEIGVNMNVFIDDKHLCSWVGLTPRCKESAGKKQSVRIIKAGQYIKPLLVECALSAIKDKSCPYITARYSSIKSRHGHKKAIIAIARLLLTWIYHILNNKVPFDNVRYDELLEKKFKKQYKKKMTEEDMIAKLTELGYSISKAE